jgi:hypothetical protein
MKIISQLNLIVNLLVVNLIMDLILIIAIVYVFGGKL